MALDPCNHPSSQCREDARGWVCSLPGQTAIVCTRPTQTSKRSNLSLNEIIGAIKAGLSLAGYDSISTSIDAAESSVLINADVKHGDNQSASNKAKEAIVKLSMSGIKGLGGLLTVLSEPVIKEDGKLYMKVKIPILYFNKFQQEQSNQL